MQNKNHDVSSKLLTRKTRTLKSKKIEALPRYMLVESQEGSRLLTVAEWAYKQSVNIYPTVGFYDSAGMTAESFPANKRGR